LEVVGNGDKDPPEHIGATAVKVGIIVALFTVIVKVVIVAHCPGVGVKV
jgi:Flp pilus assembly pilin Flp